MASPTEFTLDLTPSRRIDILDVSARLAQDVGDALKGYSKAVFSTGHTTAGYLDERFWRRLGYSHEKLESLLATFERIFPQNAGYEHDKLHLRHELSVEERKSGSKNADSHLTYITTGLRNCVTYEKPAEAPVVMVELDGIHQDQPRTRRAEVFAYHRDEAVAEHSFEVPVSSHPIDSVNLRDAKLGIFDHLQEVARQRGITRGRVDISLADREEGASLTVNEYETLLMQRDLRDVLREPLKFAADRGRSILRDPLSIPEKTINYAQYDFVQVLNELMDKVGVSESILERIVARFLAVPASHFLRLKRNVSFYITDREGTGTGTISQGTWQSPILMQWKRPESDRRRLVARWIRFK